MNRVPISVCIIAKNEAKNIEDCLKRLLQYHFEIVVVDTGSTDRTVEIADKYADQVLHFQWNDNFSDARNYAISHATYPWIMVLDCDELVDKLDVKQLQMLMQKHIHHVGMLLIDNVQLENGKKTIHKDQVPRFFNRNYFHYEFRIHEQVTPIHRDEKEEIVLETFSLPMAVTHMGYCLTPEEMQKKQERNILLLQAAIGRDGNDDYLYFQLGQSFMVLHRIEEAMHAYEKCFQYHPDCERAFMQIAVCSYARALGIRGRYEQALEHVNTYNGKIDTPEFFDIAGRIYLQNNQPIKALQVWLKLIQNPGRESLGEEEIYYAYVQIIKLFQGIGSSKWAEQFRQEFIMYASAHGKQVTFS